MTAIPTPISPMPSATDAHAGDEPIGDVLQRLDRPLAAQPPGPVGSFFAALFTQGGNLPSSW